MKALEIKGLKKTYPSGTYALKGIDLDVEAGDFFALLGPNGAGKSTTIGIITSLINKSAGSVKIFGTDIDKDFSGAKTMIGIVPQEVNLNIFEKVFDIIVQQAGFFGIGRKDAEIRAEKYLKKLDLWKNKDTTVTNLSGGMKRRLMIARALMHEPKLLILDEPTAGVDIEIRRSMYSFLKELNNEGTTIILTTHYLEEAEQLCRNVAIIDNGVIRENTTVKKLINKLDIETFIIDIKEPIKSITSLKCCEIVITDSNTIEVSVPKGQSLNQIFNYLDKKGIIIVSMRNKANRLEELFVRLTGGKK